MTRFFLVDVTKEWAKEVEVIITFNKNFCLTLFADQSGAANGFLTQQNNLFA